MNMIVSSSAVAAATVAVPAVAEAALSERPIGAILQRAERIIQVLRTHYVCDGWSTDDLAAEQALGHLRKVASDSENADIDDGQGFEAMVEFIASHGQSLDWVIRGDPSGMICAGAARSMRAASVSDDPIFAAIERHQSAFSTFIALCRKEDREGESPGSREAIKAVVKKARAARMVLAKLAPTTPAGLVAYADYIVTGARDEEVFLFEDGERQVFARTLRRAVRAMSGQLQHVPTGSMDDPVFAVIERHCAALAAQEVVLSRKAAYDARAFKRGRKPGDRFAADEARVGKAERQAACAFAETVPTTAAGLAEMLSYVDAGEFRFGWLNDEGFRDTFIASVHRAVCALHGMPAPSAVAA